MKLIYLTILLALIIAFISLPFIPINITSQSSGIIRAKNENIPIISVVNGQITFLQIANNQTVTEGDTLVIVQNRSLQAQTQNNQRFTNDYSNQIQDLNYLIKGGGSLSALRTSLFQKQLQSYLQQKQSLQIQFQQAQREYNRYKKLYDDGVVAQTEFMGYQDAYENAKAEIDNLKSSQIADWQSQKRQLQEQIQNLQTENQQIAEQKEQYYITAPAAGTLINYNGLQKGGFIVAGQTIATISPDEHLLVECYVEPKDIGFLKPEQQVKFQMQAFDYNQWGLAKGKVVQIDRNITIQENTPPYFRVLCSIDTPYLQLKNGYKGELKKGMTLTARFFITERSLYDLLFDKVDDWMNPKIEVEE